MTWKCRYINCSSYDEAIDFIKDEDRMFPLILEGYRYIFLNNLVFLDLVEFTFGGLENIRISLDIIEPSDTLDKLITWLEKNERYEECQEILNFKGNMY
jgi:hypothetical protein